MREYADIRVMAPLLWYPAPVVRRNPALRAVAELPSLRRDDDGSLVRHPRRLHVPRFYALHAALSATSVLVPLGAEIKRFRPDVLFSAWTYPDGTAATMLGKLFWSAPQWFVPWAVTSTISPSGAASALTDALAKPWNREDTARTMQRYTLAQTARQYSEIREEVALHHSSFAA